ncbi:MAG: hypothetical protein FIB08_12160 [Candidatus Methanoperedens sp.]|nr:hypothetical protein [Candidatus Methanoperedens sp.]
MKSKIIPAAIAIVSILIIVYTLVNGTQLIDKKSDDIFGRKNISKSWMPELPEFAQKTSRVAEAYIYAAQNQDKVMYLACYCGCAGMQHSEKLISHKSLKDCYIKADGSFEPHAAECKLCNDITLEARDMLMKGSSLKDVRKTIDDMYSGRGVGTDTPMPP